jgi:hypothetical protein
VLALGAALTVAGCSGDGGSAASPSPKASTTVSSTASVGTAEGAALTADTFAARITEAQRGETSVHFELTTMLHGQQTVAVTGVTRLDDPLAVSEKVTVAGTEVTLRIVGDMAYMNAGELSQGKWIEVDPTDTSNPLASAFEGMLDTPDPNEEIDALNGAITSFTKSGRPEDFDGVGVQRYVITVDTDRLGGALKSQTAALGQKLPKTLTYSYWLDDEDRVRKVETDVVGSRVIMTFSRWGEPVTITAPSKDDILPGGLEDLTALQS